MSYEPTVWNSGDTITSAKLNKLEQGVAAGGGLLIVNIIPKEEDSYFMKADKTWREINDAAFAVFVLDRSDTNTPIYKDYMFITEVRHTTALAGDHYYVECFPPKGYAGFTLVTDDPDDYPAESEDSGGGDEPK